ncbi:hypothetical protein [Rhodopseudomonas palustris]|uniref:hypothetical protein n=1 Tax=Rhodopseudomonas palustris TaxID=1076 RepID=UPI0012ED6A6C
MALAADFRIRWSLSFLTTRMTADTSGTPSENKLAPEFATVGQTSYRSHVPDDLNNDAIEILQGDHVN